MSDQKSIDFGSIEVVETRYGWYVRRDGKPIVNYREHIKTFKTKDAAYLFAYRLAKKQKKEAQ